VKVVWTDRAKARLKKIHAEIAEEAPRAADDLVRRLVRRSLQLQTVARSGRKVPEYDRDDIRELKERPYRIIYQLSDRVDVVAVMHYRQLLPGDVEGLYEQD
jgi:toxin ParE1/3/4